MTSEKNTNDKSLLKTPETPKSTQADNTPPADCTRLTSCAPDRLQVSPDRMRQMRRAMTSPTLHVPDTDQDLYQRSYSISSPGVSPVVRGEGEPVFVYFPPNQDPLAGVNKVK